MNESNINADSQPAPRPVEGERSSSTVLSRFLDWQPRPSLSLLRGGFDPARLAAARSGVQTEEEQERQEHTKRDLRRDLREMQVDDDGWIGGEAA